MGFLDRLLGRNARPAPASPEALRDRLLEAVHAADEALLARLCAEHETAILAACPTWLKVPPELRQEPARLQRYVQGMMGIARCLAETRQRPEMLQRMMGPPAENPLLRWQETVERAKALMDGLDFEGALALLTPEAERIEGLSGGSADTMKAMTAGNLATCYFQLGRAGAALPLFQRALALCQEAGDAEGIVAYLDSLFEVHRYLGQGAEAAQAAGELAAVLKRTGPPERAHRFRKLAGIVQRGEPLNRVVADVEGVTLELDELPASGALNFRFSFRRNRPGLSRPTALVEHGRELAREGRFEEALALFAEAGRLDPHSPEPPYNAGLTLLHLERAREAVDAYDTVEALAPGWFHCRSDRWLAAGIAEGRIPYQAFGFLRALENPALDARERLQLARGAVRAAPQVPEFKLHLARQLAAGDRRNPEAWQVFADGLQQAKEPDIRSRLLVEAATLLPPSAERDRMLQEALNPAGNLVAAATAWVLLRTRPGPSADA